MFGGAGIYHDGLMFGLAAANEVYLKTDADSVEAFRQAGSRPFLYEKDGRRTEMSYWRLPEEAYDNPDRLKDWADRAYAAALRAKARKR